MNPHTPDLPMFEDLYPPEPAPAPSAQSRWDEWMTACRESNRIGGDNFLKTAAGAFIIDSRPQVLKNGAIVGRVHQFVANGLRDIGGFKIAAGGEVIDCPDVVRPFLPEAQAPHAPA